MHHSPRLLPRARGAAFPLLPLLIAAALAACGGGHDEASSNAAAPVSTPTGTSGHVPVPGSPSSAPTPGTPSSAPTPATPGSAPGGSTSPSATHASFWIDGVDWLEPVLTPSAASRPLVAGRPVSLRVRLHGSAALPVTVGVSVYDAQGALLNGGPKPMTGPAAAPTSEAAVTDAAYRYAMDPAWMRQGVRVEVQVDPEHRYAIDTPNAAKATVQPPVARGQVLRLSVVPVVIDGTQAVLPADEDVRQALMAAYPLSDVVVTRHAPYTSTSVTQAITADNEDTLDAWGKLLGEIAALRRLEGVRGLHYYGFIPKHDYWGVVGIGYMPGATAVGRAPLLASDTGWGGTLRHESGHNFGRPHSPCGVDGDTAYPYAGGLLGSTWGYDRRNGKFFDPSSTKDLMSYCGPSWVSDWTYDHVQAYFETSPLDDLATALSVHPQSVASGGGDTPTAAASDLLLVQGRISGGVVQLQPPVPFRGQPDEDQGTHRLVVRYVDGSSAAVRFTPQAVDHAAQQTQFAVAVPARAAVAGIEVYRGAALIHQHAFSGATAANAKALRAAPAGVQRDRDGWTLHWSAGAQAHTTITWVGTQRSVLALGVAGSSWHLGERQLPQASGAIELGISEDGAFRIETLTLDGRAAQR